MGDTPSVLTNQYTSINLAFLLTKLSGKRKFRKESERNKQDFFCREKKLADQVTFKMFNLSKNIDSTCRPCLLAWKLRVKDCQSFQNVCLKVKEIVQLAKGWRGKATLDQYGLVYWCNTEEWVQFTLHLKVGIQCTFDIICMAPLFYPMTPVFFIRCAGRPHIFHF